MIASSTCEENDGSEDVCRCQDGVRKMCNKFCIESNVLTRMGLEGWSEMARDEALMDVNNDTCMAARMSEMSISGNNDTCLAARMDEISISGNNDTCLAAKMSEISIGGDNYTEVEKGGSHTSI